jgi:hypothetical protein
MPPRKTKKTTDTIGSRLALVMKSGKGALARLLWHNLRAQSPWATNRR